MKTTVRKACAFVLPWVIASCGGAAKEPAAPAPAQVASVTTVSTAAPKAADPCEHAQRLRSNVPELMQQGKLDRTVRAIHEADRVCPSQSPLSADALRTALGQLETATGDGRAAIAAGLDAKAKGNLADAQRLLDAGIHRLEAATGATMTFETFSQALPSYSAVAWSGADTLAVADGPNVRIMAASTLRESLRLRGHAKEVTSLAVSRDESRLASSDGQDLRVWDAATGKELWRATATWVHAFSSDGTRIAAIAGTTLGIWDTASGKQTGTVPGAPYQTLSPDFRLTASADERWVKVRDAASGREVASIPLSQGDRVSALAFSPDGQRIAAAGDGAKGRTLRVW